MPTRSAGLLAAWYGKALTNPFVVEALQTSLTVGLTSAVLAALFGTMAALGLQRVLARCATVFDGLVYVAIMVPGIVIGIATLIALVTLFGVRQSGAGGTLAWHWAAPPQLQLGLVSLIAAHTLFTMALAILIVRARLDGMDRVLVEASMDLYATPLATFRQVDAAAAHAGDRRRLPAWPSPSASTISSSRSSSPGRTRPCRSMSSPRSAAA